MNLPLFLFFTPFCSKCIIYILSYVKISYFCYLFFRQKLEEISKKSDAHAIEMLSKQNLEYEQQIQTLTEQINRLKSSSNNYFEEKDRLANEMLLKRKTQVRLYFFFF